MLEKELRIKVEIISEKAIEKELEKLKLTRI